jgi:flavin-dependent dehydrogenase
MRVRAEMDVLVCGGGMAGAVAAIASARSEPRTTPVARYGTIGGWPRPEWRVSACATLPAARAV